MAELLVRLVNISIAAGVMILALMIIRAVFRRMPRRMIIFLWSLVALRLIIPFSIQSPLSVFPTTQVLSIDRAGSGQIMLHSGIPSVDEKIEGQRTDTPEYKQKAEAANTDPADTFETSYLREEAPEPVPQITDDGAETESLIDKLAVIWLCGLAAMLMYAAVSSIIVKIRVRGAEFVSADIWLSDRIGAPFLFGISHPRIYMPRGTEKQDLMYIIAHEREHIRHHDHIFKLIGFLLLCVYWINPLVWLGFILFGRDLEYRCDEAVIDRLGMDARKAYAKALINSSAERRYGTVSMLAFAEARVKTRVEKIMRYKKARKWVLILSGVLAAAFAVFFLTDPVNAGQIDPGEEYMAAESTEDDTQETESREAETSEADLPQVLADLSGVTNQEEPTTGDTTAAVPTVPVQVPDKNSEENSDKRETESTQTRAPEETAAENEPETKASEVKDNKEPDNTTDAPVYVEMIRLDYPDGAAVLPASRVFWEDDGYQYWIRNDNDDEYINVYYSDGTSENVMQALENGRVKGRELLNFPAIGVWRERKTDDNDREIDVSRKKATAIDIVYFDAPPGDYAVIATDVVEVFWEDDEYYYLTSSGGARTNYPPFEDRTETIDFYYVRYTDGTSEPVMDALRSGRITGSDAVSNCISPGLFKHEK